MAKAKGTTTQELGRNVKVVVENDKMTIEIDLAAKTEPSASGKTLILATSGGNKKVGEVFVGLNVYKYATKK
jgi:hypothetical protein